MHWQQSLISRAERREILGQAGATVWITGLPAAGKSTLGAALERRLVMARKTAYHLDGDNLRHGLNGDLGFDAESRAENVRRTAHAARLLADAGILAIVSLISPYAVGRALARSIHAEQGLPFLEVYVDTPLALCEERDPKGLYARARRGDLRGMTGVDDPYEPPAAPDLTIRPAAPEEQTDAVMAILEERSLFP